MNDKGEPLQVEQTINVFKYDAVKQCIDTILTENVVDDNGLGLLNSELSLPFKFAFNTLIKYGILVKEEYEWKNRKHWKTRECIWKVKI